MKAVTLNNLVRLLVAATLAIASTNSIANTVILPSDTDDSLAEIGGILDTLYGLDNLVRIDDDSDQWWIAGGDVEVTVVEKLAAYKLKPGTIDSSDVFTGGLTIASADNQQFTLELDIDEVFRFGLDANKGQYLWSSQDSDNIDLTDHMVTWQFIGRSSSDPFYIIAFEDLPFPNADGDYQDLVLEISGASPLLAGTSPILVPVPGGMFLMLSALGLMVVRPSRTL